MQVRHLYLTANTPPEFRERIRASKLRILGADELVQPNVAVPGSPGRVLAFEEAPGFACDYALVNASTGDTGLDAAMKHVLGIQNHPKGVEMAEWLSRTMGVTVTEVKSDVPAFR